MLPRLLDRVRSRLVSSIFNDWWGMNRVGMYPRDCIMGYRIERSRWWEQRRMRMNGYRGRVFEGRVVIMSRWE
eukprot:scaffold38868_cov211-Skeletonema_dohrnii-CCMP3373.AAC.1